MARSATFHLQTSMFPSRFGLTFTHKSVGGRLLCLKSWQFNFCHSAHPPAPRPRAGGNLFLQVLIGFADQNLRYSTPLSLLRGKGPGERGLFGAKTTQKMWVKVSPRAGETFFCDFLPAFGGQKKPLKLFLPPLFRGRAGVGGALGTAQTWNGRSKST